MFPIYIFVGIPFPGKERVLLTNNFAIEESGEFGILISEPVDLQVSA